MGDKATPSTAAEPTARAGIAARALADQSQANAEPSIDEALPDQGVGLLGPDLYNLEDAKEDTTAIAQALYRVPLLFSLPKDPDRALKLANDSAQRAGRRLGRRAALAMPNWLGLLAAASDGVSSWLDEVVTRRCEERDEKARAAKGAA